METTAAHEVIRFAHCIYCKTSLSGYGENIGHAAIDAIQRLQTEHTYETCERTRIANEKAGL